MTSAIVLFAHGSRDPDWAVPFGRIKALVAQARPDAWVDLAFLEFMTPTLEGAVAAAAARGVGAVSIVPLFLATGGHLRRDLPERVAALAATHPGVSMRVLPAIGESEGLLAALARWVAETA